MTRWLSYKESSVFVDVGAKFACNLQLLQKATLLPGERLISPIDDLQYRKDYIQK